MSFSDELKEEPVYEDKQEKKQAEEKFDIAVEDIFPSDLIEQYKALKAEQAAAAAEAAAAAAAEEETTTTDSSTSGEAET